MTTKIAIWLGFFILMAIAVDWIAFGLSNSLFVARRWLELLEYIAFWR